MSGGICSIISAALVAMEITFGIMPFLLDFCRKRGYYDLPGGRKVHHCAIPRLGGLLFMPSMFDPVFFVVARGTDFKGVVVGDGSRGFSYIYNRHGG